MRTLISIKLLTDPAAQPRQHPFEIYDTRLSGFTLRVQPSGVRCFYARFGRNRRFALGKVDVVDPDEARANCQRILGNVAHGRHPLEGLAGIVGLTLGQFIDESYAALVSATQRALPPIRSTSSSDISAPDMRSLCRPSPSSALSCGRAGA